MRPLSGCNVHVSTALTGFYDVAGEHGISHEVHIAREIQIEA
jgi:hypothetical protein